MAALYGSGGVVWEWQCCMGVAVLYGSGSVVWEWQCPTGPAGGEKK